MYAIRKCFPSRSLVDSTQRPRPPPPPPKCSPYPVICSLLWILLKRPVLHFRAAPIMYGVPCTAHSWAKTFSADHNSTMECFKCRKCKRFPVASANLSTKSTTFGNLNAPYTHTFWPSSIELPKTSTVCSSCSCSDPSLTEFQVFCSASNYKIVNFWLRLQAITHFWQLKPKRFMQRLCTFPSIHVSLAFVLIRLMRIHRMSCGVFDIMVSSSISSSRSTTGTTYTEIKSAAAVPSVTHYLRLSVEFRVILIVIYIYSVLYCKLLYYLYRNVDHGKVLYLPIPCIWTRE